MKRIQVVRYAALVLILGTIVTSYAQRDQQDEKQNKPEKQAVKQPKQGTYAPPQRRGRQTTKPKDTRGQQPKQQDPRAQLGQREAQQRAPHVQQSRREPQRQDAGGHQPLRQPAQQDTRGRQPQPQRQQDARRQETRERTREQARAWQQQRGWVQRGGWQGHASWERNRAQRWELEHRNWAQRGGYGGYYIPRDHFSLYFGSEHSFRIRSRPTIFMGYPRFQYGGFSFMLVDPWPEYWAENWYDTDDLYIDYDDGYYLYNRRHPGVGLAITVVL